MGENCLGVQAIKNDREFQEWMGLPGMRFYFLFCWMQFSGCVMVSGMGTEESRQVGKADVESHCDEAGGSGWSWLIMLPLAALGWCCFSPICRLYGYQRLKPLCSDKSPMG